MVIMGDLADCLYGITQQITVRCSRVTRLCIMTHSQLQRQRDSTQPFNGGKSRRRRKCELYPVYTIEQTSSRHRANVKQTSSEHRTIIEQT